MEKSHVDAKTAQSLLDDVGGNLRDAL